MAGIERILLQGNLYSTVLPGVAHMDVCPCRIVGATAIQMHRHRAGVTVDSGRCDCARSTHQRWYFLIAAHACEQHLDRRRCNLAADFPAGIGGRVDIDVPTSGAKCGELIGIERHTDRRPARNVARILGERGYDVHLREAEEALGGLWKDVARYPRCQEWGRVISYREGQLNKLKNVEVHLGVDKMTADDVLSYGADRVVIATGSHWSRDGLGAETHAPIPGADASLAHCLTPEQIMAGKPVGERVIIVDGDSHFTGLAMAELLADQGKQVTIVTDVADVAEYTVYTMELANSKRMMHEKNIAQFTYHWPDKIAPGRVSLYYLFRDSSELLDLGNGRFGRREGTETFDVACDSVVLVTSRVPNSELFDELKARKAEWADNEVEAMYRVGDCHAPQQLMNAIFDAHRLAREFDSPNPERFLPWIRERQIWGAETFPKLAD